MAMIVWPDSLVREIAERRVVFFVGAGVSKTAHQPFPTWAGLLVQISKLLPKSRDRELVKKLVNHQRLLDAAQIITDGSPDADLSAEMRHIFQIRPTPHHTIYEHLLSMDPKTIVTTNYDEFLEKNFEYYSGGTTAHSVCKHKSTHLLNDLRSPIRSIVKIHGCITEPSDLVLDRSSYFRAKRDNQILFQAVTAAMTVNTVLFTGYSVSDPDIQLILENINLYGHAQHPHYALVPKFDHAAIKNAMSQTYNISFIEYPAASHTSVPEALEALMRRVTDLRSDRGIV
jgi:hypothetical protein